MEWWSIQSFMKATAQREDGLYSRNLTKSWVIRYQLVQIRCTNTAHCTCPFHVLQYVLGLGRLYRYVESKRNVGSPYLTWIFDCMRGRPVRTASTERSIACAGDYSYELWYRSINSRVMRNGLLFRTMTSLAPNIRYQSCQSGSDNKG